MNADIEKHLPALRDALTRRRAELTAEVNAADQQRRDRTAANAATDVTDPEEDASRQQRSEVRAAEQQRDIDELAQIDRALHRMDAGTYGACSRCGEPIAWKRLEAQPAAQRCAACQEAVEQAPQR